MRVSSNCRSVAEAMSDRGVEESVGTGKYLVDTKVVVKIKSGSGGSDGLAATAGRFLATELGGRRNQVWGCFERQERGDR